MAQGLSLATDQALTATQALHDALEQLGNDNISNLSKRMLVDICSLKKLALKAHRSVLAMQRYMSADATRVQVREQLLREAIREDSMDRAANAARVLDKQRSLIQGNASDALFFERAHTAAHTVELAIAALCPHQTESTPGVRLLAQAQAQAQATAPATACSASLSDVAFANS